MQTFNRIKPMSDDVFARWQARVRENERMKSEAIAKKHDGDMNKYVEKIVERVVPDHAVAVDPDAPHGRCPRCSQPFTPCY
jgi:hypothetical protein